LVCSFQNETADLLYEALDKIPILSGHIIRVYPRKKINEVKADTVFMKNSHHKEQERREKLISSDRVPPRKVREQIQREIYDDFRIFVTTCGTATNQYTVFNFEF